MTWISDLKADYTLAAFDERTNTKSRDAQTLILDP
jgi:hypothetical protein